MPAGRFASVLVYMLTVTMADLQANLKDLLDQVKSTHERYVITRHGEPDAVLMSVEDLEALEETLEILGLPLAETLSGSASNSASCTPPS